MTTPRMTAADVAAAAICALSSLWVIYESTRWPAPDFVGGPALIPRGVAVGVLAASAYLAWRAFKGRSSLVTDPVAWLQRWRILGAIVLTIVLAATIEVVGFLPATILYLLGFGYILGEKRPLTLIFYAIGLPLGMYLVFRKALNVPLPEIPWL